MSENREKGGEGFVELPDEQRLELEEYDIDAVALPMPEGDLDLSDDVPDSGGEIHGVEDEIGEAVRRWMGRPVPAPQGIPAELPEPPVPLWEDKPREPRTSRLPRMNVLGEFEPAGQGGDGATGGNMFDLVYGANRVFQSGEVPSPPRSRRPEQDPDLFLYGEDVDTSEIYPGAGDSDNDVVPFEDEFDEFDGVVYPPVYLDLEPEQEKLLGAVLDEIERDYRAGVPFQPEDDSDVRPPLFLVSSEDDTDGSEDDS